MNIDIKLHKNDLPEDLDLGNIIAVDGEFMGLNVKRDPLCLIQISTGNSDAHIIQLDRKNYTAPNLNKVLSAKSITKIFHYGESLMGIILALLASAGIQNLSLGLDPTVVTTLTFLSAIGTVWWFYSNSRSKEIFNT